MASRGWDELNRRSPGLACRALPFEEVERSSARCGRRGAHWWEAGDAGARRAKDAKAAGVCEGTFVMRWPVGDALRSLEAGVCLAADAIEVGKNTPEASHAASLLGAAFGASRSDDRRFQPMSFPM